MFKFRIDRCSNFVLNISIFGLPYNFDRRIEELASKQLVQVHLSYNLAQPSINSQQAKFQLDAAGYCNRTIYCNQQNIN